MARAFPRLQLPASALAELERRVPDFPMTALQVAVSQYVDLRDNPPPPPKATRDDLDKIAISAIELAAMIGRLDEAGRDYIAAREVAHGSVGLCGRLPNDLRTLMSIAEMARRDAEQSATPGRPTSPRTLLVGDLAASLAEMGLAATAEPQGRLVLLFAIALRAAGDDEPSDPVGMVKSSLRTLAKE